MMKNMTIAEIIEKAINDNSKRGLSTEAICQHAEFEIKQQWQLKTENSSYINKLKKIIINKKWQI